MIPHMTPMRGRILTLVAFVSHLIIIKMIFAMIDIHYFLQFDASSLTASIQLTEKSERYMDPFLKAPFSTGRISFLLGSI